MANPGRPRKEETSEQGTRNARPRTRSEQGRRQRKPLGQPQQKLKASVPDGMQGYWFNDKPGRLQQALEAGYTFISDEGSELEGREGARSELVGTKEDGTPMHAYLMAIPKEWYQEDQQAKQASVDETDAAIRRGNIRGADQRDSSSYYVPDEGISIRND